MFIRLSAAPVFAVLMLMPLQYADCQTPMAPPPQIPYGVPISTRDAKVVAAAAIAEAQSNGWNMAIAIVDAGGHLVLFERMQNTQIGSIDVSMEKARTSALFRRETKVFQDAVAAGGANLRILRLTGAIPIDGGVPIIVGGKLIGAIGVSGGSGEQDGQVARSGVAALK